MLETDILTASKVAKELGITETMVTRYCRSGRLPGIRHGKAWLILRSDFESFVRRPRGNPAFFKRRKKR